MSSRLERAVSRSCVITDQERDRAVRDALALACPLSTVVRIPRAASYVNKPKELVMKIKTKVRAGRDCGGKLPPPRTILV